MGIEYLKETYQMQVKPLFMRGPEYFGDKEAICSPDHDGKEFRCTWKEAYHRICQLANALKKLGIAPGDKVGTLGWNGHRHMEISFAVPMMGAVFHPANFRYSKEHLISTINHSKDKILFVEQDIVPLLEEISESLNSVECYIIMSPSEKLPKTSLSPVYSYEALLSRESTFHEFPDDIPENALAILCYTGGTTGAPKGVGYSPRSIVLCCMGEQQPGLAEIREGDTILSAIPLFHVNSHHYYLVAAMTGASIVLPGPHPTTEDQLKLIETEKVTVYMGAFVVIMFAIQEWEKGEYDLSSLKTIISGASAPEKTLIDAMDRKGLRIFIGYGSAEARTLITASSSSRRESYGSDSKEKFLDRMVMQGRPVAGVEMSVRNLDTGEEVSRDGKEIGEVLVRGLWIGQEYYNHPEGTGITFKDNWLHSGDVGVVQEDGTLCLVDRVKDVIKSGGEWISSVDLENAIMANPAVRHVAVIGVPHPKWQERPAAVVMLKDEYKGKVSEQDILKPLETKIAKWWMPDHVAFVDELPMTGTMKILKRDLREDWINGKIEGSSPV